MLLTPLMPLANSVAMLVDVHNGFVDVVHVELQFIVEICAIICSFVIFLFGVHGALGTYVHPTGEHLNIFKIN
jgi:hypothetical protein